MPFLLSNKKGESIEVSLLLSVLHVHSFQVWVQLRTRIHRAVLLRWTCIGHSINKIVVCIWFIVEAIKMCCITSWVWFVKFLVLWSDSEVQEVEGPVKRVKWRPRLQFWREFTPRAPFLQSGLNSSDPSSNWTLLTKCIARRSVMQSSLSQRVHLRYEFKLEYYRTAMWSD